MESKNLVELLKEKGLEIAEDQVCFLVKSIFEILPEIVLRTDNKFDDLLIPLLGAIKPTIDSLVDKIDGKNG